MLKNIKRVAKVFKLYFDKFINSEKIKRLKLFSSFILRRRIYCQKGLSYVLKFSLILSVIVTSVGITSIFTKNNAQAVYINDSQVGFIDNTEITESELYSNVTSKISEETGTDALIKEKIELVPVIASNSDISTEDEIVNSVKDQISFSINSFNIVVNGEEMACLKSKEDADKVLEKIKNERIGSKSDVVSAEFTDKIEIIEKETDSENIISKSEAYDILNKNIQDTKKYVVQSGDTIEKIASKVGLSTSEIYSLNPDIDENSVIHIGEEIAVTEEKPLLSLKVVKKVSYNKDIPFETEEVKNDTEYKTYKKVLQEGKNGSKKVIDEVTYVNNKEVSRKTLKETNISKPTKQKVEVGTLEEPPKKATGNFKLPVSGTFTSGFGARWGTVHKGIDIAAPAGTPVYASDGGVVTFAGWNSGGYGNLVKISHENGLETYYAHNTSVAVSVGDRVAQGQLIAYVGTTGDSTGNHCHFEIRDGGVAHDPMSYLGGN